MTCRSRLLTSLLLLLVTPRCGCWAAPRHANACCCIGGPKPLSLLRQAQLAHKRSGSIVCARCLVDI